jgi:hypothetical protein
MPKDFFYGWAEGSVSSSGFALSVGSSVLFPTSVVFGTCLSGAGRACFGSSAAVCGPRVAIEGACGSGTTLSALICFWPCYSVLDVLVGGGVALPESSSGFWVNATLYKSITSYTGGAIAQLCHTYASF